MKQILLFIVTLAFCSSHAGIRVIHGGGGYAEMVSLSLLSRLESLIVPCVTLPERCGLPSQQTEILRQAIQAGIFKTQMARLEFSNEAVVPSGDENRITLTQSEVYGTDGKARSASDIAIALFKHWLDRPSTSQWFRVRGVDVAQVGALAEVLFPKVSIYEESLEWDKVVLHALNFRLSDGQARVLISLEEEDAATDMTAAISAQITCAGRQTSTLHEFRSLHLESGFVIGHLRWRCGSEIFTGLMALAKTKDEDKGVTEIRVNLLGRSLAGCGHELEVED